MKNERLKILLIEKDDDAVERKRLERFQEEFVQNAYHEMRTPLCVVHGYLSCLLEGAGGPLEPEQRRLAEIAARNVNSLIEMIEELADVTRVEAGRLTFYPCKTDLGALAKQTVEELRLLAGEKRVALSADFPADLPLVWADPKRTRQILINLIGNAIKFTPREGRVCVSGEHPSAEPGALRVCVADTGPGIAPDELERVFERFRQERPGAEGGRAGLGLGLYICRQIAVGQRGRIWAESELGRGSRFYFMLPAASAAQGRNVAAPSSLR